MAEEETVGRPRRPPPERVGEDDRERLLGAPKPGAPVSTPLAWEELTEEIRPREFSIAVALDRVARLGDLFAPVLQGGQALGPALRALRTERAEPRSERPRPGPAPGCAPLAAPANRLNSL